MEYTVLVILWLVLAALGFSGFRVLSMRLDSLEAALRRPRLVEPSTRQIMIGDTESGFKIG